ncbi:MAG: hypothetical protein ABL907_19240 [Hyphomicrobium sp.]
MASANTCSIRRGYASPSPSGRQAAVSDFVSSRLDRSAALTLDECAKADAALARDIANAIVVRERVHRRFLNAGTDV